METFFISASITEPNKNLCQKGLCLKIIVYIKDVILTYNISIHDFNKDVKGYVNSLSYIINQKVRYNKKYVLNMLLNAIIEAIERYSTKRSID